MVDTDAVSSQKQSGIGLVNAILLVINAEAGAGILNFPEAFKRSGGVFWALALQSIFLCFTTLSLTVLNHVSAKYKTETLGELCFLTGGISLGMFTSITIAVYGMFSLTAYMVVIADNWDLALYTLDRERFCGRVWYYNRAVTALLSSLLIILPNCFPKKVTYLRYAARVGVFGLFYVTMLVNVYWWFYDTRPGNIRTAPISYLEFVSALPTFCYAYHCHVQAVPIFHSLRNNTNWKRILLVSAIANGVCWLLFSSVGINGYLSFGDDVFENILLNYDANRPPVVIAVIFIVIKICCTYPVVLFVTRKELITLYNFFTNQAPQTHELRKRIIAALFIFTVSIVVMSTLIDTVGVAFGFSGTLIALDLFFFPGLLLLLSITDKRNDKDEVHFRKKFLLAVFLIVIGLLQFCLSFGLTVRRLVHSKHSPPRDLCD